MAKLEEFKRSKNSEVEMLSNHLNSVFTYAQSLSSIIQNLEAGRYAVYERTGIKSLKVPASHKPGPLDEEVMRTIRLYSGKASSLAETTAPSSRSPGSTNNMTVEEESVGAGDAAGLQEQVQALKNRIAEMEAATAATLDNSRAQIEEEVLNDLANHPTVEYIKRLEDDRSR